MGGGSDGVGGIVLDRIFGDFDDSDLIASPPSSSTAVRCYDNFTWTCL